MSRRGSTPTEWPAVLAEAVTLGGDHGLTEPALAARLRLPLTEICEPLSHVVDDRPRLSLVPPG